MRGDDLALEFLDVPCLDDAKCVPSAQVTVRPVGTQRHDRFAIFVTREDLAQANGLEDVPDPQDPERCKKLINMAASEPQLLANWS